MSTKAFISERTKKDAELQVLHTSAILKAAVCGVAQILREHQPLSLTADELDEIGWGLEYALADADKARIASEKATEALFESELADLEARLILAGKKTQENFYVDELICVDMHGTMTVESAMH